jgi:DNA-directed RNA polymerase specialized sigma24 family protein
MLRLFDDFSYAEIAATVDVSEDNAERLYNLAHAKMTRALNHCFRG